jgi:hypothetical protein
MTDHYVSQVMINGAGSTGRCNTIQRTDSTVLPWAKQSAWLNPVKT